MATIFGVVVSIAAAYVAAQFNNIMDFIQLVFGFVNAPLFATFLLGMFWKRTTGHGAFFGLVCGTAASAVHQASPFPRVDGSPPLLASNRSMLTAATWPRIFGWPSMPGPPVS